MARAKLGHLFWLVLLAACGDEPGHAGSTLERRSREELMNPETCASCHPRHYREWSSSMHAYASLDPVFRAMNERGQRETQGAMGDFCIGCHAPMALREGLTTDGRNIADIPKQFQGVTCYFCHNTHRVDGDHNAKLTLANDQTMRGALRDPVDPGVHGVAYSSLHDRNSMESSQFCGGCHDVVNANGVHLERTLAEYKQSIFSKHGTFDSCVGCHMKVSRSGAKVATMAGKELPDRPMHEHLWAGVDVALTDDFPDQQAYRKAVECELMDNTIATSLVATDPIFTSFKYTVEALTGHAQPSGAAQDRRLWLEVSAYDDAENLIYESGHIADGAVEDVPDMLRDHIYDAAGLEVHMFWQAAPSPAYPTGYSSNVLPLTATLQASDHWKTFTITLPRTLSARPARVVAQLRMRPVGVDILNDLVQSQDLDPTVIARMPTFTLHGTRLEWILEDGPNEVTETLLPLDCPNEYLKLLE